MPDLRWSCFLLLLLLGSCRREDGFAGTKTLPPPPPFTPPVKDDPVGDGDADTDVDADTDTDVEPGEDPCGLGYDQIFGRPPPPVPSPARTWRPPEPVEGPDAIAYADPPPPSTWLLGGGKAPYDIIMPSYSDDMPLFERAHNWGDDTRCFNTPHGAQDLTEDEAYLVYRSIAEQTTGVAFDDRVGHHTVVSLRGAYPGTFQWNGNSPDVFNDTMVLLWQDEDGLGRVLEFPVNTDTGNYNFGYHSSSSLRPNRRYHYMHGWHSTYNALHIDESGYHVEDDSNHNGHWDSDRNGWLAPFDDEDHEREGSGHNIHMASVDGPLGDASVYYWSAGCQTIPGIDNWTVFIEEAWEGEGMDADYFLVDVRDIDPQVWDPCTPDGTHACPYRIESFPFTDRRDTTTIDERVFPVYNCSDADESGPEVVYVFTTDCYATLDVVVDCDEPVDLDIYLLEGDDQDACLERDHLDFRYDITPGRYLIVVDTWVDGDGEERSGAYTLTVDLY